MQQLILSVILLERLTFKLGDTKMGLSIWQILIVALLFVLLFGRGKISDLMGDVAKGIKSFKKGIAEDEPEKETAKTLNHEDTKTADTVNMTSQEKSG